VSFIIGFLFEPIEKLPLQIRFYPAVADQVLKGRGFSHAISIAKSPGL
jgi:hypothetical protein